MSKVKLDLDLRLSHRFANFFSFKGDENGGVFQFNRESQDPIVLPLDKDEIEDLAALATLYLKHIEVFDAQIIPITH